MTDERHRRYRTHELRLRVREKGAGLTRAVGGLALLDIARKQALCQNTRAERVTHTMTPLTRPVAGAETARAVRRAKMNTDITDEQIKQLRSEAASAGDRTMVRQCDLALHGTELDDSRRCTQGSGRCDCCRSRCLKRLARDLCARAIADAAAQDDGCDNG